MTDFMKQSRRTFTDTQLLMTITIGIFVLMYVLSMIFIGGGFLHPQQIFDLLNDNSPLIIVACGLTIVMIGGGIDISVGAVTSLVVMSCVLYLNKGGNIFVAILLALGIGLAFGVVQGFLISYLEIQPFIVTLAGLFFARGMTTILSVNPQKVDHAGFEVLRKAKLEIPWLGYYAGNGNLVPARIELGVFVALLCFVLILSASQSILFHINASTGGLDILAKIVNKYFHLDIGTSVSVAGALICCTAFAINPFRLVVIGLIGTWINGLALDYFTASINRKKRVCVISREYEIIRKYIINELHRGCTLYPIKRGFSLNDSFEIQTLLTQNEFADLLSFMKSKEIDAFITAGNVSEIYGRWNPARRH